MERTKCLKPFWPKPPLPRAETLSLPPARARDRVYSSGVSVGEWGPVFVAASLQPAGVLPLSSVSPLEDWCRKLILWGLGLRSLALGEFTDLGSAVAGQCGKWQMVGSRIVPL